MERTVPLTAGQDNGPANSEMAESGSRVYRLLSALFMKEVTSDLLATLGSGDMAGALGELAPDIASSLSEAEPEKLLDDLAEEYAALFLVPGGIPPYESARLHGMLNQKPAWEAEEFYRRCGLAVREECLILPDHLGMEMEFMGYLAGREAGAYLNGDKEEGIKWFGLQCEFFSDHIDKWAFGFLEDLSKYARHPFYKGIGSLTIKFLEVEKERLGIRK